MFAIKRSDGCWYVGTADKNPVFTDKSKPPPSGLFRSLAEADQRAEGLSDEQHTFEVVPITDA